MSRVLSSMPTRDLITTKNLEIRKRRGLLWVTILLIAGPTVLLLGLRLLFHAVDSRSYGPAGTPAVFAGLSNTIAEFGFLAAAAVGAAAGTTDLADGVFRSLVVTGRSRVALYLARIPAGLAIIVPVVALAFAANCLVTSYQPAPLPNAAYTNGVAIPLSFDQAELLSWLDHHPAQAAQILPGPVGSGPAAVTPADIEANIGMVYSSYTSAELGTTNPPVNEMAKIGLWLELEVGIAFLVGLGLGSLTGQRTLSTILMIVLELLVTPIFAAHQIPYFINGQRLDVGIAMDQLRPAGLAGSDFAATGPVRILGGSRGSLQIPPMPTWAMISVIVGWIIGWTALGAWRMATRDA